MARPSQAGKLPTIRFRATHTLIDRIDEYMRARGLKDRSESLRSMVMEATMTPTERSTVPSEDELVALLGVEARAGNVTAINSLLKEKRRAADVPAAVPEKSVTDQLAERRAQSSRHG